MEKEAKRLLVTTESASQAHIASGRAFVTDIALSADMFFSLSKEEAGGLFSEIKAAGKRVWLNMPLVFRKRAIKLFDEKWTPLRLGHFNGFIAQSMDELFYLNDRHITNDRVILGERIYTYNDIAVDTLKSMGYLSFIAPSELNEKELMHRRNEGTFIKLYGYQIMMITANCIHKNTYLCDGNREILKLMDRKGMCFPVRNVCPFCYNVIYNHLPTSLFKYMESAGKLDADYILEFCFEDEDAVNEVLDAYERHGEGFDVSTTAGHFHRGVE